MSGRVTWRNTAILAVWSSGHPARTKLQAGSLLDGSGKLPELRNRALSECETHCEGPRTASRIKFMPQVPMKDRSLSPMEKTAREIVARLRENGYIAYFAGGCVRDSLRGQAPKDFDIATDAKPEGVQKLFPRTYAVGAHFGVILVVENDFQFEVATFRSDEAYIDGRHPAQCTFHLLKKTRNAVISQSTGCFTIRSRKK